MGFIEVEPDPFRACANTSRYNEIDIMEMIDGNADVRIHGNRKL
jgi:hypothetical protein